MDAQAILAELSMLPGVSGHEAPVARAVRYHFEQMGAEVRSDKLGNLIALKRGQGVEPRPKVMIAAHMDEIGLIVTKVEPEGFLRFTDVGGYDPRVMPGQEVLVYGRRELSGIIGAKPPHVQDEGERSKAYPMEELYIDLGFSGEELRDLVRVGDIATLHRPFVTLAGNHVAGKAFDDRAGVVSLLVCLAELARVRHEADVYLVATVQEETGVRGAFTSTFGVMPDIGIAIDVTFAEEDAGGVKADLGKGPAIGIGPHVHPTLNERFLAVAKDLDLPFQIDPSPTPAGTDAYAIQISRSGVPTILVSIPQRNIHTSVEVVNLDDVRATGRLLAGFIQEVDRGFTEGLLCF